jgi:K+-sensing histidine kinase KdpD
MLNGYFWLLPSFIFYFTALASAGNKQAEEHGRLLRLIEAKLDVTLHYLSSDSPVLEESLRRVVNELKRAEELKKAEKRRSVRLSSMLLVIGGVIGVLISWLSGMNFGDAMILVVFIAAVGYSLIIFLHGFWQGLRS